MKTLLIHISPNEEFGNLLNSLKLINKNLVRFKYIAYEETIKNFEFKKLIKNINYKYDEILNINSTETFLIDSLDKERVYKYLDTLLNDSKTMSIFERSSFGLSSLFMTSNTKRIRLISILYFQAIKFLKKVKPKAYIIASTPHSLPEYLIKWACVALQIDVVYLQDSILPWRYYSIFEKDNNRYLLNKSDKWSITDKKIINDLKKKLRNKDYLAPYEVERKNSFKNFSLIKEISTTWMRPDLIINKYIVSRYYENLTKKFKLPNSDYIFFPLQFNPERTTLPEGDKYFEQFRALHEIRVKFDKKIKIIVKEHPSTFSLMCHWKERNKNFYKLINNLGNISFAPVNYSTVKLIKNSSLSISINSSVVMETLLLDKYCCYMSGHKFFGKESKNLLNFKKLNKNQINTIFRESNNKKNYFDKYWFENYTFNSSVNSEIFENTLTSLLQGRAKCFEKLIQNLVNIYIKNSIKKYLKKIN
jgi:hypothetical protein